MEEVLTSMEQHLQAVYAALEEKGATMPENKNIENLAETIRTIA